MITNKTNKLIEKAYAVLSPRQCPLEYISLLEERLNVQTSCDFYVIAQKANHEYSAYFEWSGFPDGIISDTEHYRSKGLPHRYIILADEGDGGIVLLETQDNREKPSPVIWCDYPDISNLCECGEFKLNPRIWPSFTDFFEYLIEREEKIQNEELN